MDRNKREVSMSIDVEVLLRIDEQSKALGLSRSAFTNIMLRQTLGLVPSDFVLGKIGQ